jgi:hypothetical protein
VLRFAAEAASAGVSGSIMFYNPADKHKDVTIPLALDPLHAQRIPTGKLPKGMWKIQISWKSGGSDYFFEQPVVIN